jgi:hypothetical protein
MQKMVFIANFFNCVCSHAASDRTAAAGRPFCCIIVVAVLCWKIILCGTATVIAELAIDYCSIIVHKKLLQSQNTKFCRKVG